VLGLALLASACRDSGGARSADSDTLDIPAFDTVTVRHIEDSALPAIHQTESARTAALGPLVDSVSQYMTFLAKFQRVFVAAGRAKRLLLDVGRVDAKLRTPALEHAYQEAMKALSPVRVGDRFRLHGSWGADDAVVTGYAAWNGRMVAVLDVPPVVDSLLRRKAPVVAFAVRADSAEPPVPDTCARDSVNATLRARIPVVRDSLLHILQTDSTRLPTRLVKSRRVQITQAIGCFGGTGRAIIFANLSAGAYQFVRELPVLVDTAGRAAPLKVSDLRFKAHEVLRVLDADGDGVDDIAAIGHAERTGGTVVLRLDPAKRRLEYMMSGFAWENY
jgi:hypothetical protein